MILQIDKVKFLEKCHRLLDKIGEEKNVVILGKEHTGKVYFDEVIYIAASEDKKHVEIERLRTKAPIVFINQGETMLFSGDFIFLAEHVEDLLNN